MAKKPTITTIVSGAFSTGQLNGNFTAIRDAFDNTLSLDGSTPNSMGADLDMNSKDILNGGNAFFTDITVGGSSVAASAAAAAASAAAAAASYDDFDDRYLGAKAVAPTLDNDGNALLVGAVYWDTVSNQMFIWSGAEWRPTFLTGNAVRALVTATGGQTVVTVPTYLVGANTISVFLNGLKVIVGADYTETDQNTITFASALTGGDEVEVLVQPYAIGTTGAESVTTEYGVTLARLLELREGTVAQLLADTTLNPAVVPVGSVIEAGGFRYEAAASGASDHHVTTAGGVKLYVLPPYNLKAFGAVGDGVADDTVAVDNAFTHCGATGERLYVPAGTYPLSSTITWTITNNFEVECGVGAVFKATSSIPADYKLFLPSATSGSQKFVWRGGTLDGRLMPSRVSGAPDLLYIASQSIKHVTVEGVTFICNDTRAGTAGDSCLFLAEGEDFFVSGCTFRGAVDLGVYISGNSSGTTGRRAVVTGNTFIECESGVGSKREFEDHIVANNFFQDCTIGVFIGGETEPGLLTASKAVISENLFKNVTRGIEARVSDGAVITNNRVENFGFNESGVGIAETGILISGSDNCLVSGNYVAIISGSPSATATAIRITPRTVDATTYQSEYTLIEGNVIFGAPRGIVEDANSNFTVVGPNIIINATTATISLVGANSMQGVPMAGSTTYRIGGAGEPSLEVVRIAGAANYVQIAGSASTTPTIATGGTATDVNLVVAPKNAGVILLGGGVNGEALRVSKGVSSGNALQVNGAAAGSAPALVSRGADANVDLAFTPKGAGLVRFGSYTATPGAVTGYIEVKDAAGTTRRLAVIS